MKKPIIPIPPPAIIPEAQPVDPNHLLELFRRGEVDLFCVMGPTASGKTRFAVALAHAFRSLGVEAEIISADSRQVYVGMDIGTGKDLAEYGDVPYHLIDTVPAGERYNICRYQRDFSRVFANCRQRGVVPVLCGGSGLYVEAVTRPEYELGENVNMNLLLSVKPYYLATVVDRQTRRDRIDRRLDERLLAGMAEEVQGLLDKGVSPDTLIYYGLEYKFVTLLLLGRLNFEEMHEKLRVAIHQFAKRQMTWLRGMEKDGLDIHWVSPDSL